MKKIYIVILLILIFSIFGCNKTTSEATYSIDEILIFEESDIDSSQYLVSEGNVQVRRVIIPSEYNGKSVTGIEYTAFKDNDIIEYIYIPNTITTLKFSAFENCTNLKEVIFEEGSQLTSIGVAAFKNTDLISITIPSSVEEISHSAFAHSNLSEIAFQDDSKLEIIGSNSFVSTNLETINIPGTVNYIQLTPFVYSKLRIVIFEPGDEELFFSGGAFTNIDTLEEIHLESRVVTYTQDMFRGCADIIIYINVCDEQINWQEYFYLTDDVYATVINICNIE